MRHFEYDAAGNLVGRVEGRIHVDLSYDANDRLLSSGEWSFEFDDVGNTVKEFASENATVVVGTVIDPEMTGDMRVTIVGSPAAGGSVFEQQGGGAELQLTGGYISLIRLHLMHTGIDARSAGTVIRGCTLYAGGISASYGGSFWIENNLTRQESA